MRDKAAACEDGTLVANQRYADALAEAYSFHRHVLHMMLFDHFDRIRINSLAYRTDRRAGMLGELRRVGLHNDPRVAFFDALSFQDPGGFRGKGSHGNFKSQLAILEEAEKAGHSVLILEDDCDFTPGAEKYQLPPGWQIFYGGYVSDNPDNLENSRIVGSHFMGFSAETAPLVASYLRAMLEPGFPPDPQAVTEPGYRPSTRPSIDGAYVWFRRAHPEIRTVFARPPLGYQRPSRSDCSEPKLFDRTPGLRDVASVARRAKRQLKRFGMKN